MPEVVISPVADAFLDSLYQRGQDSLLEALEDALDWIEAGDKRSRAHSFKSTNFPAKTAWAIFVHHQGRTWTIASSEETGKATVDGIGETFID
jgi:hypothetical protein